MLQIAIFSATDMARELSLVTEEHGTGKVIDDLARLEASHMLLKTGFKGLGLVIGLRLGSE